MAYVYLLGDWEKENTYKVGVTRGKIEKRIKELQTGNSGEIYICSYYETKIPFFLEKTLHMRYTPYHVTNEWYELPSEVMFKFKEECQSIEDMADSLKNNPFFRKNLK